MKLLLTHRFFWPDSAPYGVMLWALARGLAAAGHEVYVQTAVPSYRTGPRAPRLEVREGVEIYRCGSLSERGAPGPVRALNAERYVAALVWRILRLRPDVVTASTFPPVVAAWAAGLAARAVGARFVYHVQDIHPEVSQVVGGRMGRAPWASILRALDNATLRRAACVVTLSADMAQTLRARGVPIADLRLIPNPGLTDPDTADAPLDPAWRKAPGRVRAIFAGNLGRFQNLPLLAEGVARLFPTHPALELVFLGEGPALPGLRARWGDHPQVRFLPQVPIGTARALMAEADIGLAALRPGMFRVASPSKVQTYLEVGLPVVALVEPESQLARELEADGVGFATRSLTPEGVSEALTRALAAPRRSPPPRAEPLAEWVELIEGVHHARP